MINKAKCYICKDDVEYKQYKIDAWSEDGVPYIRTIAYCKQCGGVVHSRAVESLNCEAIEEAAKTFYEMGVKAKC